MNSFIRLNLLSFALTLIATAAAADVEKASSPIRSFDWAYQSNPEPGNRHWSSPDGISWTETYPSGHAETHEVEAAAQVNGCSGVIVGKSGSPTTKTFIPNPGCPNMVLLLRLGDLAWQPLGEMRSISSGNAAPAPPAGQIADPAFGAIANMLKPPSTPAALTPERIEMARRYLEMMQMKQTFKAFEQLASAQLKSQSESQIKGLTPSQRVIVRKLSADAIQFAEQEYERSATERLENYYAAHLAPAEFEEAFAFYNTPLGRRLVPPFTPMTPDERQEVGRYVLTHPAMQKLTSVQFGALQMILASRQEDQAKIAATIKSHLCQELIRNHLGSPSCSVTHRS